MKTVKDDISTIVLTRSCFLTADIVLDYHQSESYIMSTTLLDKLKPEFHTNPPAEENGILLCLDEA